MEISKIKRAKLILIVLFFFCGCATVKEGAKGFLGISVKALEDARPNAIKQIFKYDSGICFEKSLEILEDMHTYIYARDPHKKYIAVYLSVTDTTPIGIFFTKIDEQNTQVEVSSLSSYAKEYVAEKLFAKLIILLNPVKGKLHEIKRLEDVKPPEAAP